ncbi:MAG: amino acid racemase [Actinomycetaceae bacterium]|nr:amino acid racemase [Actinomycetaceae bacterium]
MKRIGLIGGTSWESTVPYYEIINRYILRHTGGIHTADLILRSLNFHEIESRVLSGRLDECFDIMATAAKELETAGADFLAICSNTLHKTIPAIEEATDLPIIHIVDVTAERMRQSGLNKALLLGTKLTMEESFNSDRFRSLGFDTFIPNLAERDKTNDIIFGQLCKGHFEDGSRQIYKNIIDKYCSDDTVGAILGCTEIGMLITQKDVDAPVFDTTEIHAEEIARYALQDL